MSLMLGEGDKAVIIEEKSHFKESLVWGTSRISLEVQGRLQAYSPQ